MIRSQDLRMRQTEASDAKYFSVSVKRTASSRGDRSLSCRASVLIFSRTGSGMRFQTRDGLGLRSSSASGRPTNTGHTSDGRWAWGCRGFGRAHGRQVRSFDEADDLQFPGCGISHASSPPPRSCFFEQPQFEGLIGHDLLQITGLSAQIPDLARRRRSRRVARQALLARSPWINCNRGSGQCCPRPSGRPVRS